MAAVESNRYTVLMKIRLGGFPRRQMRVVRGLTCAVLLILAACVGGTTNAGIYTNPWEEPRGPNPAFARQVVTYPTHEPPGTIIIDPGSHFLYFIHDAEQAIRYGVGVGAEGFVWSGRATVHSKQEWPDWYPPAEMLARKPELRQHMVQLQSGIGMKGGPDNPLGARAMYLWSGNKDTLYRLHGTNEPWTIGTNVSSGCIRLTNEDIVDLYNRTPIGAKVIVFGPGKPAAAAQ
jgi:lipoprotein-anchoring transpeptidase ErfK/SrfK